MSSTLQQPDHRRSPPGAAIADMPGQASAASPVEPWQRSHLPPEMAQRCHSALKDTVVLGNVGWTSKSQETVPPRRATAPRGRPTRTPSRKRWVLSVEETRKASWVQKKRKGAQGKSDHSLSPDCGVGGDLDGKAGYLFLQSSLAFKMPWRKKLGLLAGGFALH